MEKYFSILSKSSLFKGICIEEIKSIIKDSKTKIKSFKKNEYILEAGEKTTSVGIVLDGTAHIIQDDFWGSRNLISTVDVGNCFGESFACAENAVVNVSVVAAKDIQVMFIDIKNILNTGHEFFVINLLSDMAKKNIRFSEKLVSLGQRSTRGKLISYLSYEAKRNGSKKFDILFSRQQLADYLFVERSGLSVELGKMKKEGLLDFNKNHFELKEL